MSSRLSSSSTRLPCSSGSSHGSSAQRFMWAVLGLILPSLPSSLLLLPSLLLLLSSLLLLLSSSLLLPLLLSSLLLLLVAVTAAAIAAAAPATAPAAVVVAPAIVVAAVVLVVAIRWDGSPRQTAANPSVGFASALLGWSPVTSSFDMLALGTRAVSGMGWNEGLGKTSHNKRRGSFSRRTTRASHFLDPP
jgi:hypothetical protein